MPELLVPDVLLNIILVGRLHGKRGSQIKAGRCTYMVKPSDVFPKYRIQEL